MIKIAEFINKIAAISASIFICWYFISDGNIGFRYGDIIIISLYFIYCIISLLYFVWLKRFSISKYLISPLSVYVVFSIAYLILKISSQTQLS